MFTAEKSLFLEFGFYCSTILLFSVVRHKKKILHHESNLTLEKATQRSCEISLIKNIKCLD